MSFVLKTSLSGFQEIREYTFPVARQRCHRRKPRILRIGGRSINGGIVTRPLNLMPALSVLIGESSSPPTSYSAMLSPPIRARCQERMSRSYECFEKNMRRSHFKKSHYKNGQQDFSASFQAPAP